MIALCVALALAPIDSDYLKTAAEDNVAELKMVRMVIGKTRSPAVKNACKAMIRDHTKQLSEIRQLASRFSVDLPTAPNVKHQALYKNMSHKSGRDLDR